MSGQKAIRNPDGSITTKIESLTLWDLKLKGPAKHYDDAGRLISTLNLDWKQDFEDHSWRWHLIGSAPAPGTYHVFFEAEQKNITYRDLKTERGKTDGWNPVCSSILVQTIRNYFVSTGIRLLEGEWSRVTDGGWSIEHLSGKKETHHMRVGCNADGQVLVDFDYSDTQTDQNTGITFVQLVKKQ